MQKYFSISDLKRLISTFNNVIGIFIIFLICKFVIITKRNASNIKTVITEMSEVWFNRFKW